MADSGEDREIKKRVEANEAERFRESQQLTTETRERNRRRAPKLKRVVDPALCPTESIARPGGRF